MNDYVVTPITSHGITRYEVRYKGERIGSAGDTLGAQSIIDEHKEKTA